MTQLFYIGTGQVCYLSLSKSHALYNMRHRCVRLKVVWNHKGEKRGKQIKGKQIHALVFFFAALFCSAEGRKR